MLYKRALLTSTVHHFIDKPFVVFLLLKPQTWNFYSYKYKCTSKESSPNTPYATLAELLRFLDIDFIVMDKDRCYAFIESFIGVKCENLYYGQPNVDFPKGLTLISNDPNYFDFIAIAYECGVILPMHVDHFGNSNM
ncbi:unnamed protein product [Lactuca saligna]|uniref:Uncharacterized protein n=1 Tax=Lactuca saligna TaxID=75948 RepID=A0AA36E9D3_LACSI|nr:unnamed protein product [Lactuca saligna]